MPEERTLRAAERDRREGKSPSTQAGEFVREEIEHIREGRHGVRSPKQAIAIGLSKARRAGVDLPPKKTTSKRVQKKAEQDLEAGAHHRRPSPRRARATENALKREDPANASPAAMSRQARSAAAKRGSAARSAAAKKAARTRTRRGRG
jgi:hypothetical protein